MMFSQEIIDHLYQIDDFRRKKWADEMVVDEVEVDEIWWRRIGITHFGVPTFDLSMNEKVLDFRLLKVRVIVGWPLQAKPGHIAYFLLPLKFSCKEIGELSLIIKLVTTGSQNVKICNTWNIILVKKACSWDVSSWWGFNMQYHWLIWTLA